MQIGTTQPQTRGTGAPPVTCVWIPQVAICLLLIGALYPKNPYGYYLFLRWSSCPLLTYLTVTAAQRGRTKWSWLLGSLSFLYNPLVAIHATRALWTVANIATIVVAMASVAAFTRPQRSH